jgi:hypothetical protein
MVEGNISPSLDARISAAAPSSSLPTPPSNEPPSPDPSRLAIDHFGLTKDDLASVAGKYDPPMLLCHHIHSACDDQMRWASFSSFIQLRI